MSTATVWSDVWYLVIGYILVWFYVQVMVGKFNRVEQRVKRISILKDFKI